MELTKKQEEGLKTTLQRYKDKEKYTVISGYAGTGKSTLIKFIIDALGIDKNKVAYVAPTGKAAEVLRKKNCPNASTIHKLLYEYKPIGPNNYVRTPKQMLEYKIIVVDEVSMVEQSMVDLLLRHPVYAIFCGDPFQIPPINDKDANHLLDSPHVFLDEVMRQATESEIIRLSMDIRNYKPIPFMDGKDVKVLREKDAIEGMYTWADQIIVGTNEKRNEINKLMRTLYGKEGGPQEGDKIICNHNYWDDLSLNNNPLVNGTIGYLSNPYTDPYFLPPWIKSPKRTLDILYGDIITDDNDKYSMIGMDKTLIETGSPAFTDKIKWLMSKRKTTQDFVPKAIEYGYAITGHRAQGSQWNNVLVIEERFPFPREAHARWLYTCCTRPESKLVLLRG